MGRIQCDRMGWYLCRTPLVFMDGSLTVQRYLDNILQPVFLPFLEQHDNVNTFQQDNTRPHSARITMDLMNNMLMYM